MNGQHNESGPQDQTPTLITRLQECAGACDMWTGYGVKTVGMTHVDLAKLLREAATRLSEQDTAITVVRVLLHAAERQGANP